MLDAVLRPIETEESLEFRWTVFWRPFQIGPELSGRLRTPVGSKMLALASVPSPHSVDVNDDKLP
jgi:hypothetical protein